MSGLDEQIGKALQRRRLELGLSLLAVATELNLAVDRYRRFEEGAERIPAVQLVMLADVLQMKLADIFMNLASLDASTASDQQVEALLQAFRKIRKEEMRAFVIKLSEELARSTEFDQ